MKNLFSIFLGFCVGYLPSLVFNLVIAKPEQKNIISRMYLAEICKLLSFVGALIIIFKFLPINSVIFIVSVITYLILNFIKNLLKLK